MLFLLRLGVYFGCNLQRSHIQSKVDCPRKEPHFSAAGGGCSLDTVVELGMIGQICESPCLLLGYRK